MKRIEDCTNWEEIFNFQSRTDGANYTLLKEWLVKNYEVPLLKSYTAPELESFYEKVYDILVNVGGAPEIDRMYFIRIHSDIQMARNEWRFCGHLAFGGKYRKETNTVDCYYEDMTDKRRRIILEVNEKLQNIKR
jgi:hypothetical protein